jgi:hypothetical protein
MDRYPFHPADRTERVRVEHLRGLKTSIQIFYGTRGPVGSKDDVAVHELPESVQAHSLLDGDQGFKRRKTSGRTEREN